MANSSPVISPLRNSDHQAGILVTGATGYLGRFLIDQLVESHRPITVLTRSMDNLPKNWAKRVACWTGDLTEPSTLDGCANGIDTIYHLAGELRNPQQFDAVNRLGTESLLEVCRTAGVRRFLHLSSVGVLGAAGADIRVSEDSTAQPRNAYERSKYLAELAALQAHAAGDMRVSVVRPSIVFGEGRSPAQDSFLSWLRAIEAGRFVMLGQHYVSSYVYLGDVVAACIAVANDVSTGGQIYIVNEAVPLVTFVAELSKLLGRRSPPILPGLVGFAVASVLRSSGRLGSLYNRTVYGMDKLSALPFELPYGYREGLRRTIRWYRDNGLLRRNSEAEPRRAF